LNRRLLNVFLWLWVGVVLAAYLIQFRPLAGPVLQILGIQL
jgi:hypothetical protein